MTSLRRIFVAFWSALKVGKAVFGRPVESELPNARRLRRATGIKPTSCPMSGIVPLALSCAFECPCS